MFIIAKYGSYIENPTSEDSIVGTHTAGECGIARRTYATQEEAGPDLEKVKYLNPSVGYEILEVSE